jgi:phosphatidylglycerol:prolipoprotein diacylglycerol transferase
MYPTLFEIGNLSVSSFTVCSIIAFLMAYIIGIIEFKRKGISESLLDLLFGLSIIGGVIGAKLLFLFQNATLSQFLAEPLRYLSSGYTFYGGLLAAIFTFVIVTRLKKINFWLIGDAAAPALLLAYSIGRIGCLLIGDDYGTPSGLPWAVSFPNGSPPTSERVHPTQLYDTILMFIAFLFLWRIRKRNLPVGWISYATLLILGVERFLIEFIRSTTPSFIPLLSQAQIISVGFIVVGLYKFMQLKIRTKNF